MHPSQHSNSRSPSPIGKPDRSDSKFVTSASDLHLNRPDSKSAITVEPASSIRKSSERISTRVSNLLSGEGLVCYRDVLRMPMSSCYDARLRAVAARRCDEYSQTMLCEAEKEIVGMEELLLGPKECKAWRFTPQAGHVVYAIPLHDLQSIPPGAYRGRSSPRENAPQAVQPAAKPRCQGCCVVS